MKQRELQNKIDNAFFEAAIVEAASPGSLASCDCASLGATFDSMINQCDAEADVDQTDDLAFIKKAWKKVKRAASKLNALRKKADIGRRLKKKIEAKLAVKLLGEKRAAKALAFKRKAEKAAAKVAAVAVAAVAIYMTGGALAGPLMKGIAVIGAKAKAASTLVIGLGKKLVGDQAAKKAGKITQTKLMDALKSKAMKATATVIAKQLAKKQGVDIPEGATGLMVEQQMFDAASNPQMKQLAVDQASMAARQGVKLQSATPLGGISPIVLAGGAAVLVGAFVLTR